MSATATATSVQELDKQVNDDVLSGKAMEAFEKYYAEDVVMQENSEEPRRGKAANRKAEEEFFASVEAFNGGSVKASAVNGDVSFSEWEMDVTFKGGHRVKMSQVAVRHWKNGKIVHERFFYNKG
ncbi:MAG TPA: SnoaL-like domain-containing protein [Acidobacteriaceae bacterium]|jgi:ketosteroid isomerase-like protein|nr:SnoaL-like domain-containing protein [Acidobacteriaceae bacterium]